MGEVFKVHGYNFVVADNFASETNAKRCDRKFYFVCESTLIHCDDVQLILDEHTLHQLNNAIS